MADSDRVYLVVPQEPCHTGVMGTFSPLVVQRSPGDGELLPVAEMAAFTSSMTLFSTTGLHSWSAYDTGHMSARPHPRRGPDHCLQPRRSSGLG